MLRGMHAANQPPIGADGQLGPQRVLVVDDNPDASELLSLLLERAGHQTLVVGSARDALAAASEFRPHVALIDIGLPDMDGYKLTNLLRAQPALQHCRFIAVTGHKSASAVARSIAAGFEAHLSKPISTSEILSVIAGSRQ
jgi:CheY-like chemotaxis protein